MGELESDFFKTTRPTSLIPFVSVEEIADTVGYFSSPLVAATNRTAIKVESGLIKSIL